MSIIGLNLVDKLIPYLPPESNGISIVVWTDETGYVNALTNSAFASFLPF